MTEAVPWNSGRVHFGGDYNPEQWPRAVWAEDRDIAEDAVVRDCLAEAGFDPRLADKGMLSGVETLQRNTDEALRRGVFGAPSYVVGDEIFWGEDRLPHLDAHLAALA